MTTRRAGKDQQEMLKNRPGLVWIGGSLLLIAAGLLLGLLVHTIVAIPLLVVGAIGTIGWRSADDAERGWPPWPFGERS